MSVSRSIKGYIVASGLNQKQVAEAIGIHPMSLNRILNDKRKLTIDLYLRICETLGVAPGYFVDAEINNVHR
jgi:plasmid maintenance system antidote protein VapI